MLVFLDFDTQNDLVYPYGKYPVGDARSILLSLSNISDFIKGHRSALHVAFRKINRLPSPQHQIAAQNYGREPLHCEPGSSGVEKVAESVTSHISQPLYFNTKLPVPSVTDFVRGADRFDKPYLLVDHIDWNVFSNPRALKFLTDLNNQVNGAKFVLYGVPLDRTVFNFVKSAYNLGLPGELFLVTDAVKAFDNNSASKILDQLSSVVGVQLITTNDLVNTGLRNYPNKRKFKGAAEASLGTSETQETASAVQVATAADLDQVNKADDQGALSSLLGASSESNSVAAPEQDELSNRVSELQQKITSLTESFEAKLGSLSQLVDKLTGATSEVAAASDKPARKPRSNKKASVESNEAKEEKKITTKFSE